MKSSSDGPWPYTGALSKYGRSCPSLPAADIAPEIEARARHAAHPTALHYALAGEGAAPHEAERAGDDRTALPTAVDSHREG